jgi:hypothetical protein
MIAISEWRHSYFSRSRSHAQGQVLLTNEFCTFSDALFQSQFAFKALGSRLVPDSGNDVCHEYFDAKNHAGLAAFWR